MTAAIGTNITNIWKIFCYVVKRYQYENIIGMRELLELLDIDCFKNTFATDTGAPKKVYLSLMRSMMERHFLLTVPLFFSVLLLITHMEEIFLTSFSTVIHNQPQTWMNLLLVLIIIPKNKYLRMKLGLLEVTVMGG